MERLPADASRSENGSEGATSYESVNVEAVRRDQPLRLAYGRSPGLSDLQQRQASISYTNRTATLTSSRTTSHTPKSIGILTNAMKISTSTESDVNFIDVFCRAQEAIVAGIYPELIACGSSGSYFVSDADREMLAVFKPKDEEPFAPLNPKWPKFFQRIMCFCCVGRACLIPNTGYLSETGASVLDGRMQLNVVPTTRVVKLASPTFFYGTRACCMPQEKILQHLRPKEGSFQMFVHGFESAETVMSRWDYDPQLLSAQERTKFIELFQRMCVLDYVIRNTDRHMDNWLIRHIPGQELTLAAIDNGLAFPVKHPEVVSRIRRFPFKWAHLKYAKEPWAPELRERLLDLLTPHFVHECCQEMKTLFRHDTSVSRVLVYNQLRVLRGQFWNLRIALENNVTPSEMAQMEPIVVKRRYRRDCPKSDDWNAFYKKKSAFSEERGCSGCCG